MFGFLTPMALFGLGLLAIPVVLHIFKPRKVRELPFSSLRWLRASQHRMSRKIRWHQVLLLMLRVSLLAVLVLALASPVLSSRRAAQWLDRIVVLDVGPGMGYDDGQVRTPLERGKRIARRLIDHVRPGDRTALLRVGTRVRAFGPLAPDASVHRSELDAVAVEPAGAQLTDVLPLVDMLRRDSSRRGERIELSFITDSAAHKWSQGAIRRFMNGLEGGDGTAATDVKVNIIDLRPELVENAWIAEARLIEQRPRRMLHVRLGAMGAAAQSRTLRLTGIEGMAEQTRQLTIEPGAFERVRFELPADRPLDGQVAKLTLDPHDGAPGDDTYWVNFDRTTATRVLIVEPELTQVTELQVGHHLRTALRTLVEAGHANLEIVRRSPEQVLREPIAEADAIMLLQVPVLADGDLRMLEQRVREGAGLAVFLGPTVDPAFYNNRFHDPLRPNDSLLPAQLGEPVQEQDHRLLAQIVADHPLFGGLSDPVYGDLESTRFTRYFRIEPADGVQGLRTPARIGDSTAAILERPFGLGRVLLFNTTAHDAWSDLPRRRSYVPLVNRLISHLAGDVDEGTFPVGAAATVSLPRPLDVEVRTPSGGRMTPAVQMQRGDPVIQFRALDEVGVYEVTVRGGDQVQRFPFVVQPESAAHFPGRVDPQTLRAWWAPAEVEILRPDSADEVTLATDARWLLTPWLLALAALLLAAEMFFVHYLCPRANPALSGSVVNRRGFLRRTGRTDRPAASGQHGGTTPRDSVDGVAPSSIG